MPAESVYELENEFSPLHYSDREADPFFGGLRRFRLGGILKRLAAPLATVAATALGGPAAGALAGKVVGALTREQQEQLEAALHELSMGNGEAAYGEFESEYGEFENEFGEMHEATFGEMLESELQEGQFAELPESELHPEYELGFNHGETVHNEAALLEQIAYEAAATNNELVAAAELGALANAAMNMARRGAPAALRAVTPALVRGAANLGLAMRRNPTTRQLVPAISRIMVNTGRALAGHARRGNPITPQQAVRVMANQTYRLFARQPEVVVQVIVRANRRRRLRRVA